MGELKHIAFEEESEEYAEEDEEAFEEEFPGYDE